MTSEKALNKHNSVLGGKMILHFMYYWTLDLDCTDLKKYECDCVSLIPYAKQESVSLVLLEKRRESSTPKALANHIVSKRILH